MQVYLDCLRKNASNSTPCRHLNKEYLECRMARYVTSVKKPMRTGLTGYAIRGLMDRDEWKNLGLDSVGTPGGSSTVSKDNPKDRPKAV